MADNELDFATIKIDHQTFQDKTFMAKNQSDVSTDLAEKLIGKDNIYVRYTDYIADNKMDAATNSVGLVTDGENTVFQEKANGKEATNLTSGIDKTNLTQYLCKNKQPNHANGHTQVT